MRLLVLAATCAVVLPWFARGAEPQGTPAGAASPEEAWRGASFGMSVEAVLAALPGRAFRVSPEVKLPDGNTVSAGIDAFAFAEVSFNVRFVFEAGRLALVSLRTPPNAYVDAAGYERVRGALVGLWGDPIETTTDAALIDLRQTRWQLGARRADLKYIPGVVALVVYPRPPEASAPTGPAGAASGAAAPAAGPAPR